MERDEVKLIETYRGILGVLKAMRTELERSDHLPEIAAQLTTALTQVRCADLLAAAITAGQPLATVFPRIRHKPGTPIDSIG